MKKCPFCGKDVKTSFPSLMWLEKQKMWSFMHHCNDTVSVIIAADSKEDIKDIWNRRCE
jgi:hypothetical protein